ncbi:uncharacterized protein LOC116133279 [Pistacia vera]|uniref:uncharacterized protein LOC116133279 n=1 Tax=Pistacia vera TaxID=55513 RepID=UPI0012630519|nr:uncharacterized protein LOC116133279 [Pistacia vera]
MTRSSRHKSSKRSSRDARDYSDSEKDSSLKDRKGKDEGSSVRVSKDSGGSGEKRKLDSKESKDLFVSGNVDYEEYNSSSKRRKDRAEDSGNDRWNGGGEDDRTESGSRKSKVSSETKSKRRDDDELQRSKSEGKHRESSRKESREVERERERERKGKEGKSERFAESEEYNKQLGINEKTESNAQDRLPSPESENQLERRVRRRKDGSGDGDKHDVDIGDINDRRRDDVANDGRMKDEKHKDERYRDKFREDVDRDSRHRDDKQRDERPARDHTSSRSDDKHFRDEKDATETRHRKSKPQDSDRDREGEYDHDRDHDERDHCRERDREHDHDHDRNHDRDRNRDHDGDREWDRERNRELERDRDRDRRDRDRDRGRDRERERERDRDRDRNRDRDLDHDRDRDLDHDGSHLEDRGFKYKDSRGKKRSPDERDDSNDTKSRGIKTHYPDMEGKSLSSSRLESDADRGRSQSRQAYVDSTVSSNRRRTSPSSSSHGGDEYRHSKQEDLKYRDSVTEQRPKAISSREVTGFSGVSDRGSKYRSTERTSKIDDGHLGELSVERSSSSKASPMGLIERSPSSTSHDRRYVNRTGIRRSLDIEETGRRSSIGPRDLSAGEDRLSRELPLEKPLGDDSSQIDLYYSRTGQSNSSSSLPPPPFRGGVGSPSFMGSLEEDGRVNINARYRRSGDPSVGRGQGNAWRGAPNWSSPVPNGFMFQHGPPHGGFPAMMPQFPAPSLFTVRPSMDINHSGIPYHMPDADRFSGHLRPLGWQNMMDGSGPPHMHGWDGNNGVFRDEPHIYGGSDWDQNRHPMNGRGWETGADMWKGENGDVNMDLPSTSQKEEQPVQAPSDDALVEQAGQQTLYENNHHGVQEKTVDTKSISSSKESSKISPKTFHEKTSDPFKKPSEDNLANSCRAYLAKIDVSEELTAPDLFSKCMSLLNMDQTATVEKETTVIVNLKDGGRAVSKSSKALLSPPFFPAADDSVFQRAMDQYKKQRVQISCLQIVNGGTVDIISTCNPEKVGQGSPCDVEKAEELVLISDTEMSEAPMPASDQNKPEGIPHKDVQETLEELVSTPSQVVADHNDAPPLNLEVPDQSLTPKSVEESEPVVNGDKMDGMTCEQHMISEDADGDQLPSPDNASAAAPIVPADGNEIINEISITKSNNSVCTAEERQALADAISDPIVLSDGSPKVSEALMPGSNESESVILSRIHDSPESTH